MKQTKPIRSIDVTDNALSIISSLQNWLNCKVEDDQIMFEAMQDNIKVMNETCKLFHKQNFV